MAGVVRIKSPIRLSCKRRIFIRLTRSGGFQTAAGDLAMALPLKKLSRHAHRCFVCVQQSCSKMVPGKILDNATSGGGAHFLHDLRVLIQMLQRRRNCVYISRLYDNAFDSITDYIDGFARGDLRQSGCRGLTRYFRAAFPLGGENVYCPLVEIILRIADEPDDANIIAPELL